MHKAHKLHGYCNFDHFTLKTVLSLRNTSKIPLLILITLHWVAKVWGSLIIYIKNVFFLFLRSMIVYKDFTLTHITSLIVHCSTSLFLYRYGLPHQLFPSSLPSVTSLNIPLCHSTCRYAGLQWLLAVVPLTWVDSRSAALYNLGSGSWLP